MQHIKREESLTRKALLSEVSPSLLFVHVGCLSLNEIILRTDILKTEITEWNKVSQEAILKQIFLLQYLGRNIDIDPSDICTSDFPGFHWGLGKE